VPPTQLVVPGLVPPAIVRNPLTAKTVCYASGVTALLFMIAAVVWWYAFCADFTYRPWLLDDGAVRTFPDLKGIYPELSWIGPAPVVEPLCVVEGRFFRSTCLKGKLYVVRDGSSERISSFTLGRSAARLDYPVRNLHIVIGCATLHTSEGALSVLAVDGASHSSITCRPLTYRPFAAEFQWRPRGSLPRARMLVVSARGDRAPVVSRDMTIEEFTVCNPAGNFLVVAVGETTAS